jgi:hypothetical protein
MGLGLPAPAPDRIIASRAQFLLAQMASLIEIELSRAREFAERIDYSVLLYLIDMVILEARSETL